MDRYRETFETWNKVAALYQDKFMDLDLYDKTYDLICDSIPKTAPKLLEIGCGPGNITRYLLSKRPDFDIYGIDIAPRMIELARKNNPSATFDVMDCREIGRLSMKFDGVVCGFCLPYLSSEDRKKLIWDIAGLLNEDGLLYMSFVEGDPLASGYVTGGTGDRTYFYYHDLQELMRDMGPRFGSLEVCEILYERTPAITEAHTVLIGKKR